jgi:hypothetical protein
LLFCPPWRADKYSRREGAEEVAAAKSRFGVAEHPRVLENDIVVEDRDVLGSLLMGNPQPFVIARGVAAVVTPSHELRARRSIRQSDQIGCVRAVVDQNYLVKAKRVEACQARRGVLATPPVQDNRVPPRLSLAPHVTPNGRACEPP